MPEVPDSERISALFAAAIELPAAERTAFVRDADVSESARHEVASLLAVFEQAKSQAEGLEPELAAGILDGEHGGHADVETDRSDPEGRLVGSYRLLRELGRGGMGVVYLAERADGAYEQQVAFKLLPPSLRSEALNRRFALERQILARLEHPGIARLLDGGVAEHGEPYLVMEYVAGEPLTEWCDERRLGIRQRLEIFLRVCDAVQYAHGRLVVHRDLKPSNILVTDEAPNDEDQVKLLDFGIAKLLAKGGDAEATELTRLGLRPYTPGYAAPEQLRGEPVTVATDVYGLGVLLYELLCGRRPQSSDTSDRGGSDDWFAPTKPSGKLARTDDDDSRGRKANGAAEIAGRRGSRAERLRRRLAGDLDTIALKALREEPSGRYESVQALADDLKRHLAGQPIAARPASIGYRSAKFLRRHWAGATAAALVVLAVLGGLAGTIWQAQVAGRERDVARAEAAKAEQVAEFLADVFRLANPLESKGEEMTVREALDRGAERIEEDLADQPVVQAELMTVLGATYLELGDHKQAEALLTRALELRRRHLGPEDLEVAETLRTMGALRYQQGNFDEAVALYDDALVIAERSLGPDAPDVAQVLERLGIVYGNIGRFADGVRAYERALAINERHFGPDAMEVGKTSLNLGTVLSRMREDERAMAAYERTLAIYERVLAPDHPWIADTLGNMAYIRMRHQDYDGLEGSIQRMLRIHRKAYGPVHDRVATGLKILAEFYAATGRDAAAIEALHQMLEVDKQAAGANHPNVAYSLHDLGDLHLKRGRPAEALPLARQAVEIRESALEPNDPRLAGSLTLLGKTEAELGRLQQAEGSLRRALAARRTATDPDAGKIASAAVDLAAVLIEQRQCVEAQSLLTETASTYRAADPPDDENLAEIDVLLARCSI